jgi:hypothetical protein
VVTAMVVAVGVAVAGDVTTVVLVVATVVCDVAMVVAFGVTLPALTGSTMSSVARNIASSMKDDPLPRDIDTSCQLGLPVISCIRYIVVPDNKAVLL